MTTTARRDSIWKIWRRSEIRQSGSAEGTGDMINIWDYYGAGKVSLKTKQGECFIGSVLNVWTAEENETDEDMIDIELSNGEIWGFMPSEIESITEIK